ncbi:MAG: type IV pilus twitching motility protein PilT [Planctomycetota bacterium JB042]
MAWIDALLQRMVELGSSDLHLSATCQPQFRLHGEMAPVEGTVPVSKEEMATVLKEITPDGMWDEFQTDWDADFAYALEGCGRFRVNLFYDHKGPGAVLRLIPEKIPSAQDLGLPKAVIEMCNHSKGLVLVTGPTGSGKSTTLAAMIDHINETRPDHIITIEDPIEFVHPNKRCLINQREVSRHTTGFKRALRAALREDPDIVLVGEMRDLETIAIAIETAETGHLVFGTLHTSTAPSTVNRIIDQFPADEQAQIRMMLAGSLRGVIAQTLCKKVGGGRVAAQEILVCNNAVSALIREGKTHQIMSQMQMGGKEGMKLLNDALAEQVQAGRIAPDEAYMKCVMKDDMLSKLEKMGHKLGVAQPAPAAPSAPASSPSPAAAAPAASDPVPAGGGGDAGGGDGYTDPFEAFRKKRGG